MADSVTYEYDLNGRLKNLTFANTDELNVTYDDMGNREEVDITIAPPLLPFAAPSVAPDASGSDAGAADQSDSSK